MKTSSDILLEAATLLKEEGRWGRGKYFDLTEQGCAMCAHGAIAYCGNPYIKNHVDKEFLQVATQIAASTMTWVEVATGAIKVVLENLTSAQYIRKHYGEVGLAHYKATKAGLTFDYNDNPNTTQQDVVNKLRKAAQLTFQ